MKVEKILKGDLEVSQLPDGLYYGILGGYGITLQHNEETYKLSLNEGVRGIGYAVIVESEDGNIEIYHFDNAQTHEQVCNLNL